MSGLSSDFIWPTNQILLLEGFAAILRRKDTVAPALIKKKTDSPVKTICQIHKGLVTCHDTAENLQSSLWLANLIQPCRLERQDMYFFPDFMNTPEKQSVSAVN